MLTQDNQAYTSQKMIAVSSGIYNTLMYTVPLGKTFIGKLIVSPNATISVNGTVLQLSNTTFDDIVLVSGTTITNASNYGVTIVGVEQ